jgi:hypothetical protein
MASSAARTIFPIARSFWSSVRDFTDMILPSTTTLAAGADRAETCGADGGPPFGYP